MPNHVHMILELSCGFSLTSIMHSIKSFSSNQANKLLGRTGAFWQPDYFDRLIRDEEHLARATEYLWFNPVKARLAAQPELWPWSSAAGRASAR